MRTEYVGVGGQAQSLRDMWTGRLSPFVGAGGLAPTGPTAGRDKLSPLTLQPQSASVFENNVSLTANMPQIRQVAISNKAIWSFS
jgi:hypothetical protein